MLGLGQVTTINDAGSVQMAQVQLGSLELRDKTAVMHDYGFSSNPPAGSDIVVAFIAGDRANGVAVASNSQAFRFRNLASGETVIYDNHGRSIYMKASGIVVNAAASPVTVENATEVDITATVKVRMVTPLLECTGDIVDNCDSQTETMAAQRSVYDGHTHNITNVQAGIATVTTLVPNQQEV